MNPNERDDLLTHQLDVIRGGVDECQMMDGTGTEASPSNDVSGGTDLADIGAWLDSYKVSLSHYNWDATSKPTQPSDKMEKVACKTSNGGAEKTLVPCMTNKDNHVLPKSKELLTVDTRPAPCLTNHAPRTEAASTTEAAAPLAVNKTEEVTSNKAHVEEILQVMLQSIYYFTSLNFLTLCVHDG